VDILIDLNSLILLIPIIINLGLGIFIFFTNPRNNSNRLFSFILFLISFWSITFLLFLRLKDPNLALVFRRLTPIGSSLIAGFLLYFSLIFPESEKKPSFLWKFICFVPGIFFAVASIFSPLMITSYTIENPKFPFIGHPNLGILYDFFTVYLISYFIAFSYNLYKKYLSYSGNEKRQLFYILTGVGITIFLAAFITLIMPIFGIIKFFTIAPALTLIIDHFISLAMVRHGLFGCKNYWKNIGFITFGIIIGIGIIACILVGRFDFIFTFIVSTSLIFLSILIYTADRNNGKNISFTLISISLVFWNLFTFMLKYLYADPTNFFWLKSINISMVFVPALFLYFSKVFPYEPKKVLSLEKLLIFVPALLLTLFIITNKIITGIKLIENKHEYMVGWAQPLFVGYFFIFFSLAFFNLYRSLKKSHGTQAIQLRYIFFGFALNAIIGLITNLLLPTIGITQFILIGPGSTIIFIGVTAYTIVRHRLMDIEIVIQKGVIYTTLTSLIIATYVFMVVLSEQLLKRTFGYNSTLVSGLVAIIIAIFFHPLLTFLKNTTSKYFYPKHYDYKKVLKEISHKIAIQIRMDDLAKLLASTFTKIMHTSEVALLILNKGKARYISVPIEFSEGESKYKRIEIDQHSPIANGLKTTKDVLFDDEIKSEILRLQALRKKDNPELLSLLDIKEEMESLGGSLWVPIFSGEELTGIIFLGSKLLGDTYTLEEITLLITLAKHISTAFENTNLYEEVLSIKNYTQDILDTMPSGVLTISTEGSIITFNPMAEHITGLITKDIIGKNFKNIFSPENPISLTIYAALNNKCFTNFEANIIPEDKESMPISLTSTLLKNSQEKITGVLLTITNLAQIRSLKEKLKQTDKINALGTMAASMAHEIKNPLSSMKVLSQLLPLKYDDKEFRGKIIEIIPKEVSRIDRVIESLLNFARSTAPQFIETDINKLIDKDVKYFYEQAKNNGIKITTNYAELPQIKCDTDQLTQVFSNLILNAIQAMPEGGELKITTGEGQKIDSTLCGIKITISDTGHGISKENLKKLFDPFFTTKSAGTGLGLTISKSIIESHSGTMEVSSIQGKGTTFTINLPLKQKI